VRHVSIDNQHRENDGTISAAYGNTLCVYAANARRRRDAHLAAHRDHLYYRVLAAAYAALQRQRRWRAFAHRGITLWRVMKRRLHILPYGHIAVELRAFRMGDVCFQPDRVR